MGSQGKRPDSTCRTCKGCRLKKVRCDGIRPRCRSCRVRDQPCEYPPDARRSATRGKKEDIRQQQPQLEEVRNSITWRESHLPSPGVSVEVSRDVSGGPSRVCGSSGLNERPVQASLPESHCSPLFLDPRDETTDSQRLVTRGNSDTPAEASQSNEPVRVLSPESAADNNEEQVYGATSLLRIQSLQGILRSPPACSGSAVPSCDKIAQQELISAAAIGRQAELTIFSMPTVGQNIDFDGIPKDLGMHLLGLHWNRQHLSYLLSYRPAIMDSLINNGPYVNKLLLNAIFYSSCLYSDQCCSYLRDPNPQESAARFYNRFKILLPNYLERPTMPTIVALLLCGSTLVPQGKQSVGWTFCGMAYRMLIDLGYHLDIPATTQMDLPTTLSTTELEIRRRVFWGAYVCDKFQSIFLGRSPALSASVGTISREYLDTYEELEEWRPYTEELSNLDSNAAAYRGRPSYALSTFRNLIPLCTIASRIIEEFYSPRVNCSPESSLLQARLEIRGLLDDWRSSLPPHLRFDPNADMTPPPHQITPHTTYWTLVILLEQPFVQHDDSPVESESQKEGVEKCIEAAIQIWRLVEAYREAFTLRRAQYSISYATYCAALVMLKQCPRDRVGYIQCVHFFWDALLEFQRGCSAGLKKPLKLLKSLMTCFGNVVRDNDTNRPDGRQAPDLDIQDNECITAFDPGSWGDLGLDALSDEFSFANNMTFDFFI